MATTVGLIKGATEAILGIGEVGTPQCSVTIQANYIVTVIKPGS